MILGCRLEPAYILPEPSTPQACEIFRICNPVNFLVNTGGTHNFQPQFQPKVEPEVEEQVVTRKFKDLQHFQNFIRVGQHVLHASPCVDANKLICNQPLVYEEWNHHTTSTTCEHTYLCRRRRKGEVWVHKI